MAITVTVVDDHPAVVAGISAWLAGSVPPIHVVASGPDVEVAFTERGRASDIVILDLVLGDLPYRPSLKRLVDDGRKVIVYTMCEDEDIALSCIELGAFAVLTKAEGHDHLIGTILAAAEDRPYLPPSLAGAMVANRDQGQPRLSDREEEVLTLWFQCESKQEVARRAGVSVRTVGTFLDRVRLKYAKVGRPAPTKAALMARALQDGLITIDDL
ncbi:response regulator transcription factor [Actinophytocola oryzae]|uniref:LuxR family two component transcriptional regulator n=1 Tax=Actinophytocola oryzae TaxID=502181 RepID=A0A4R7W2R6_9PSEU|nr:response regulator transcription factor [Actinophytocola oryzae]TDV56179.1 LuxR family two component transcriptional regulator [Actinophytocola oryzae]